MQRQILVAHYTAMDIGVVTPKLDGMNLVAKEMLICNPNASLILSTGAGVEQQLFDANFYTDAMKYYHRVDIYSDVFHMEALANTFYDAAIEDRQSVSEKGKVLKEYLVENDIKKWSASFLDQPWFPE